MISNQILCFRLIANPWSLTNGPHHVRDPRCSHQQADHAVDREEGHVNAVDAGSPDQGVFEYQQADHQGHGDPEPKVQLIAYETEAHQRPGAGGMQGPADPKRLSHSQICRHGMNCGLPVDGGVQEGVDHVEPCHPAQDGPGQKVRIDLAKERLAVLKGCDCEEYEELIELIEKK